MSRSFCCWVGWRLAAGIHACRCHLPALAPGSILHLIDSTGIEIYAEGFAVTPPVKDKVQALTGRPCHALLVVEAERAERVGIKVEVSPAKAAQVFHVIGVELRANAKAPHCRPNGKEREFIREGTTSLLSELPVNGPEGKVLADRVPLR